MLPSDERLRRASVFQRAYNKRMVVSTSIVTMYILPKEGKRSDSWRPLTGFVVAKKVSKSAVKRNRAKRRIREVYRLMRTSVFGGKRDDIALKDWYAIVFVAHEAALEATYEQVEEAVVSCLVRGSSKNRKDRQGVKEPGGFSKSKPPQSSQNEPGRSVPLQPSSRSQSDERRQNGSRTANREQGKNSFQKPPETKS